MNFKRQGNSFIYIRNSVSVSEQLSHFIFYLSLSRYFRYWIWQHYFCPMTTYGSHTDCVSGSPACPVHTHNTKLLPLRAFFSLELLYCCFSRPLTPFSCACPCSFRKASLYSHMLNLFWLFKLYFMFSYQIFVFSLNLSYLTLFLGTFSLPSPHTNITLLYYPHVYWILFHLLYLAKNGYWIYDCRSTLRAFKIRKLEIV